MKEVITTFILALIVTCVFSDIQAAPFSWPVGLSGTNETSSGLTHDDMAYPEVNYTDGNREMKFMTSIDDKSSERNAELPFAANN